MNTFTPGVMTKNDYAYAQLRDLILTGELSPGSPLQQGKLAKDFGLSTTPLREAIRRLAAEGLITLAAHRDARVAEVTEKEAADLYQVRCQLDPLAASLAATHRTEDELSDIIEAESLLVPLTEEGGVDGLLRHREFHRRIYRASHNPILVDMLERLWDKADRYRIIGLQTRGDSPQDFQRVSAEHAELVTAIGDGDAERAQAVMERHIRGSLGNQAITVLQTSS